MLDNIVISLVNFNTNFLSLVTIYSIIVMIIINEFRVTPDGKTLIIDVIKIRQSIAGRIWKGLNRHIVI